MEHENYMYVLREMMYFINIAYTHTLKSRIE